MGLILHNLANVIADLRRTFEESSLLCGNHNAWLKKTPKSLLRILSKPLLYPELYGSVGSVSAQ